MHGPGIAQPPWPNGQGVGLLIRRLWVRVPQGVFLDVYTLWVCQSLYQDVATIAEPGFDPGTFGL